MPEHTHPSPQEAAELLGRRSAFGDRMLDRGRELVEAGLRLDEVLWDADEVLWDWAMDASRMARRVPVSALTRSVSHREWVLVKPGVFELLVGMHQESIARGLDPWIRIWTNGYAWRLWRFAVELPLLAHLLGPPASTAAQSAHTFAQHPRLFCRADYARAIGSLVDPQARRAFLEGVTDRARDLLAVHLAETPLDSTLKVPELAPLAGKDGFARGGYLIDDFGNNIKRFIATGRRGVRIEHRAPYLLGKVPNTVWRAPVKALHSRSNLVAAELADALAELVTEDPPASRSVRSKIGDPDPGAAFHVDIPHVHLRGEWMAPMRQLKKKLLTA